MTDSYAWGSSSPAEHTGTAGRRSATDGEPPSAPSYLPAMITEETSSFAAPNRFVLYRVVDCGPAPCRGGASARCNEYALERGNRRPQFSAAEIVFHEQRLPATTVADLGSGEYVN